MNVLMIGVLGDPLDEMRCVIFGGEIDFTVVGGALVVDALVANVRDRSKIRGEKALSTRPSTNFLRSAVHMAESRRLRYTEDKGTKRRCGSGRTN